MSYWDAACLVKLYVDEPNSVTFREFLRERDEVVVSGAFVRLEFFTTMRRKEAHGEIGQGCARKYVHDFDAEIHSGDIRLIPVDDDIRAEFERVVELCYAHIQQRPAGTSKDFIRTLDALHIAAARVAGESEIVATDSHMRTAAGILGFQLFPAPTP